jgi:hypothetical protein
MSATLTHQGSQTNPAKATRSTSGGRLRGTCHRIRLAVAEMNYAARRVVEVQAPWIAGK